MITPNMYRSPLTQIIRHLSPNVPNVHLGYHKLIQRAIAIFGKDTPKKIMDIKREVNL